MPFPTSRGMGPRVRGDDTCCLGTRSAPADLSAKRPPKKKGPQLALEPLDGQGIAGYLPEPKLWTRPLGRSLGAKSRENSVVVGALAVVGDVETFALLLHGRTQADDHVDDLVEDRRTDTRPQQRRQHGL